MSDEDTAPRQAAPRRSRWLILLTALLALFQMGAVIHALQLPPDLALQLPFSPALNMVAGVIWSLIALFITLRLIQQQPGAGQGAAWLWAAFGVYTVVRLVLFTRADYDLGRLPFLLVVSALLICIPVVSIARSGRA
ncbi:MAG: hypothetical protein J0M33_24870 [Anaerolineae bacterium]|nr:hypothetical protein [Anaerolineae bacterium]